VPGESCNGSYGPVLEVGQSKQLLAHNWIVEDAWQAPRRVHRPRRVVMLSIAFHQPLHLHQRVEQP